MAAKKNNPVDPLLGIKYVLDGRVVTMNNTFRVLDKGRVYVDAGVIRAVSDAGAAPPAGFDTAPVIKTGGTMFPGLIELHNHLSYNALQLWQVPRVFAHRGQWASHPDKRRLISQPMSVLAGVGGMIEGLVRYVEAKCLVAGVTTTQGLTLVADAGIEHHYRGIVRNVEATDDPTLPEALTRIADVDSASSFKKRLKAADQASLILHLAEGIGPAARKHFLNLQLPDASWAISPALVGIHSAGLADKDFDVMAANGGSIVWSPLSNLLLYADTCDVKRARQAGVTLALGSDWSPSGSKNLLSELKVARAWSDLKGGLFTARELVAMATINPAKMIKWDGVLGSLAPDKRADILVIRGKSGDPYELLLKALEDDIALVFINGVPRFGDATLMNDAVAQIVPAAAATLEKRKLAGAAMAFNFVPLAPDPLISQVPLAEAQERLTKGLHDLPDLASGLADPLTATQMLGVLGGTAEDPTVRRWVLALDNEPDGSGAALGGTERPLAPWSDAPGPTPFGADALAVNAAAAANLISMELDSLSIVEDDDYFERLAHEITLPPGFAAAIAKLHGATVSSAPSGTLTLPPVADSPEQASPALPRSLSELAGLQDRLSPADRVTLVRQLRATLEDFYVHLPLKRAAHAVDPAQRLRLLQYALEENAVTMQDFEFHKEILSIFTELRDLHTQYVLPPPFNELTVFLPFLVEECYEGADQQRRPVYLATKLADALKHPTFRTGVELLYWNGMPIQTAIRQNAERHAGSNLAARFARGIASMTIRPLDRALPPEEEWVLLTYRAHDQRLLEIRLPWQIRSLTATGNFNIPPLSALSVKEAMGKGPRKSRRRSRRAPNIAALASFAIDGQMEAINGARRDLYAGGKRPKRRATAAVAARSKTGTVDLQTGLGNVFRARIVKTPSGRVGYLRIFTFNVSDADAFVAEVVRLLRQMPQDGVILDVRNNSGGLIWAAEQLLQLFVDGPIESARAQFINTPSTLALARLNAPSPVNADLDLKPWVDSIARAVITACVHSEAFPITPDARANSVGRKYKGPVVLITDALAYSATDIFAAGFQDHKLGPIIGVDDNTGAGGANVWSYSLLQNLAGPQSGMVALPGGCDLRLAMRRTLRVGANRGTPLEDLGVVPDERYYLTRRDVLGQNEDLVAYAASVLAR